MQIINKRVSGKVLRRGNKVFKYKLLTIIKMMLFAKQRRIKSQYYQQLFWDFTFKFQRHGKCAINFTDVEAELESYDLYLGDLKTKELLAKYDNFIKRDDIKTVDLRFDNQAKTKLLVLENPHSKKWVIGIHGWTENKYFALRQVAAFFKAGYNVLTYDCCGHGEDSRSLTDLGYSSHNELQQIISWLQNRYCPSSIGLIGNSMGGSIVVNYLSQNGVNPLVKWAINDCGFSNLEQQFRYVMEYRYDQPWWMTNWRLNQSYAQIANYQPKDFNLVRRNIKWAPIPLLIFHGTNDTFVPIFHSYQLLKHRSKQLPDKYTQFEALEGLEHIEAISQDNEHYLKTIFQFAHSWEESDDDAQKI